MLVAGDDNWWTAEDWDSVDKLRSEDWACCSIEDWAAAAVAAAVVVAVVAVVATEDWPVFGDLENYV